MGCFFLQILTKLPWDKRCESNKLSLWQALTFVCVFQHHLEQREPKSGRRRHKSAIVNRSISVVDPPFRMSSRDDSSVQSRTSLDDSSLEDLAAQEIGVQTGSSLTEGTGLIDNETSLESLILGKWYIQLKKIKIISETYILKITML